MAKVRCRKCHGHGKLGAYQAMTCPVCKGHGFEVIGPVTTLDAAGVDEVLTGLNPAGDERLIRDALEAQEPERFDEFTGPFPAGGEG